MITFERRQQLLEYLRKQPGMRVPELAEMLQVSEGTIRNDLQALEAGGQLTRVRGGAALSDSIPFGSPSFASRAQVNLTEKQLIGRWAAEMVNDGDSILLDASTTIFYLARFLKNRNNLRVVTNGIEVARSLAINPTNTVILLGGVLNQGGGIVTGSISEKIVDDLHAQYAFVSCSGFNLDQGLMEVHLHEAQLKSKAIQSVDQVVALVDSSKFGKSGLTAFARPEQLSHLFTDEHLSPEWIERLRQGCFELTICGKEEVARYSPCDPGTHHYRIGFANQSNSLPFAVDVRRGLEQSAKQTGNIDLILGDNQLNPSVAVAVAEHLLSQDLDLFIQYQIDESTGNRIMSWFQDSGIPVIAVDIPIVGATYFGVDNYRSGFMAGAALGAWIHEHWEGSFDRLLILEEPRAGSLVANRIQGQIDGLQDALGKLPLDQLLRMNSGNTSPVSEKAVADCLRQTPQARRVAIICFNDEAALGALEAARKGGRERDVVIVGQGADRLIRAELRDPRSRIIGSTAFFPEQYGQKLVQLSLRILRGEAVPPADYMQHVFITAKNIEQYYPDDGENLLLQQPLGAIPQPAQSA